MRASLINDLLIERTVSYIRVRFPAEVDVHNAAQIREQLLGLLNTTVGAIILDFSGTRFLDCSGVGVLVRVRGRARHADVPLAMIVPERGLVRRIMKITAMDECIPTARDLDGARAAVMVPTRN